MNIRNAWGFLSFGLVMSLLPLLRPAWFPSTGMDGTSARALWLELMGAVQTLLGGAQVLWRIALPAAIRGMALERSPWTVPGGAAPTEVPMPRRGQSERARGVFRVEALA